MAGNKSSTLDQVAKIVRSSLEQGNTIEIDRLGTFRPLSGGQYEFLPTGGSSVFIAYVDEDRELAENLYQKLEEAGLSPWMDRRNLVPGQNWPRAIERSIDLSDFFVALLSKRSLNKRSVFQAELRYALDCARRHPLDSIFFIPARLEACAVPASISAHLHHVDLFPDFRQGARRIVSMIRKEEARRKRLVCM